MSFHTKDSGPGFVGIRFCTEWYDGLLRVFIDHNFSPYFRHFYVLISVVCAAISSGGCITFLLVSKYLS